METSASGNVPERIETGVIARVANVCTAKYIGLAGWLRARHCVYETLFGTPVAGDAGGIRVDNFVYRCLTGRRNVKAYINNRDLGRIIWIYTVKLEYPVAD